jgi:4-amino-4-deoxychorismate lyase
MLAASINGVAVDSPATGLSLEDRGLSYGDGVFETISLRAGAARFLADHLARLSQGLERLEIEAPPLELVAADVAELIRHAREGIVKVIVTRGAAGRGYRPGSQVATRIVLLYPPVEREEKAISARWCSTRLGRNARLAGIKHLNRLEQVLAQNEWNDPAIAEGVMMDTEGEVVCGTASNLFVVNDGVLITADLRFSGVRGIMRQRVLNIAARLGIGTRECSLWPNDLTSASEVFFTNAVRGIRAVTDLDGRKFEIGPMTSRLMQAVESEA